MPRNVKTTRRLIASLTLGGNLQPGVKTPVDMSKIQPFIQVGNKSMLMKIEFEAIAGFTEPASQPLLHTLSLKYLLDTELVGPAGYIISQARAGWTSPIWEYLQRGRLPWIFGRDIAAGATSATRTFTSEIDFEEPLLNSPMARCWPVEAFRAGGAGLFVTWKTPVTIKGVTLTTASLTLNIYAHVFDVPANQVPLPVLVSETMTRTNLGDINPSPGIGQYLRLAMALSPVAADNDGVNSDDLSAVTQIDYFGMPNRYTVQNQPVVLHLQDLVKLIGTEPPSQLDDNSGNKSEFHLLDPQQNFDGHVRAIPLIWPDKGSNITDGPRYNDYPKLGVNGNVTTGLAAQFWWLAQKVDPRSDEVLNATVGAMTSAQTQQSLVGRSAVVAPGYDVAGADKSRAPLVINAQ